MLLFQRFMGHFTVVTLIEISAELPEEVAKEGDLGFRDVTKLPQLVVFG